QIAHILIDEGVKASKALQQYRNSEQVISTFPSAYELRDNLPANPAAKQLAEFRKRLKESDPTLSDSDTNDIANHLLNAAMRGAANPQIGILAASNPAVYWATNESRKSRKLFQGEVVELVDKAGIFEEKGVWGPSSYFYLFYPPSGQPIPLPLRPDSLR